LWGRGGIFHETWYNHYASDAPTLLPCCSVSSSAAVIEKTWHTNDTPEEGGDDVISVCDLHGKNSLLV
jgi:hypothetical protein